MDTIQHITLTTGHVRHTPRREVTDATLRVMGDLLARMLASERPVPVPHVGPYSISGAASGGGLSAIIWANGPPPEPITTIGVAPQPDGSATLWNSLHQGLTTPVATDPERCPAAPWVAAGLHAAAVKYPDAIGWLGDFERCLAWAWIER